MDSKKANNLSVSGIIFQINFTNLSTISPSLFLSYYVLLFSSFSFDSCHDGVTCFNQFWIAYVKSSDFLFSFLSSHTNSLSPSPLSPSITCSLFHSRLKIHLLINSFHHSSSTFSTMHRTDLTDSGWCIGYLEHVGIFSVSVCKIIWLLASLRHMLNHRISLSFIIIMRVI